MGLGDTLTLNNGYFPLQGTRNAFNTLEAQIAALSGPITFDDSDKRFETRAALAAANIVGAGTTVNVVHVDGHTTVNDGGGGKFSFAASEPAHAAKERSADGAWWQLVPHGGGIRAPQVGCLPGPADSTMATAIAAAAAYVGKSLIIPAGTYTITGEVDWSTLDRVILEGEVIFDFEGASVAASFPNGAFVYIGGGDLTVLPDLASDVDASDDTLTFASDPGLTRDAIFCAYNSTNGSFQAERTYYRAGEWCRRSDDAAGTSIELMGGLYAGYAAADVDCYLHPGKKILIEGGTLTIKESEHANLASIAGLRCDRLADSDLHRIRPTNSSYAGMVLDQCVGIHGQGYDVRQHRLDGGTGTYYGLVYANCQDLQMEGYFEGGRHGASGGGFDAVGGVPCRNIQLRGTFKNGAGALQDIGAFDTHGNCEFVLGEGLIDGGVSCGGDHHIIRGTILAKNGQSGSAITFREMKGCNFCFDGVRVIANGNPQPLGNGVVDMGGNDTKTLTAKTTNGGKLSFERMVFEGEAASAQILFLLRNRGYIGAEPIIVSFRGTRWARTSNGSPVFAQIEALSGNSFAELWVDGVDNAPNGTWTIPGVTKVKGWRAAGSVTFTPLTSADEDDEAITFAQRAPRTPHVFIGPQSATLGGDADVTYSAPTRSTTGGTLRAKRHGGNFSATTAGTVSWLAVLDE